MKWITILQRQDMPCLDPELSSYIFSKNSCKAKSLLLRLGVLRDLKGIV